MNIPDWKQREDHDTDVRNLLKELGCVINGKLVRWKGPEVKTRMEEMGHSDLEFDSCECKLPHSFNS